MMKALGGLAQCLMSKSSTASGVYGTVAGIGFCLCFHFLKGQKSFCAPVCICVCVFGMERHMRTFCYFICNAKTAPC